MALIPAFRQFLLLPLAPVGLLVLSGEILDTFVDHVRIVLAISAGRILFALIVMLTVTAIAGRMEYHSPVMCTMHGFRGVIAANYANEAVSRLE